MYCIVFFQHLAFIGLGQVRLDIGFPVVSDVFRMIKKKKKIPWAVFNLTGVLEEKFEKKKKKSCL